MTFGAPLSITASNILIWGSGLGGSGRARAVGTTRQKRKVRRAVGFMVVMRKWLMRAEDMYEGWQGSGPAPGR